MTRWQYAHVSAGFDGAAQQWTITLRIPSRAIEKRLARGVGWISDILNELGCEGWELVSRVSTGTSGNDFVTGWQFILKRPVAEEKSEGPSPEERPTEDPTPSGTA
jgi:hypothetical protein